VSSVGAATELLGEVGAYYDNGCITEIGLREDIYNIMHYK